MDTLQLPPYVGTTSDMAELNKRRDAALAWLTTNKLTPQARRIPIWDLSLPSILTRQAE